MGVEDHDGTWGSTEFGLAFRRLPAAYQRCCFVHNIGALISRIGFWGVLYYNFIIVKRNPQNNICV